MKSILLAFFLITTNFMFAQIGVPHNGQASGKTQEKESNSDDIIQTEAAPAPKADSTKRDSVASGIVHVQRDSTHHTDSSQVFMFAEDMPSAPYNVNEFIQQHCHYPDEEKNAKHQGTVYVEFIVEKDGTLSHFKVTKSSGFPALDAEALRVCALMPAWTPGKMNGTTVRVSYTQPFKFML